MALVIPVWCLTATDQDLSSAHVHQLPVSHSDNADECF